MRVFTWSGCQQSMDKQMMEAITGEKSLEKVHEIITARIPEANARIYEAGGGSASTIPANVLKRAQVTVVDIDETQLKKNNYANTKLLGDIQKLAFAPGSFNIVVCFNVIELSLIHI